MEKVSISLLLIGFRRGGGNWEPLGNLKESKKTIEKMIRDGFRLHAQILEPKSQPFCIFLWCRVVIL